MPSKLQDISPVLFVTVDGESMTFFLRPGPVKRSLQPLITAGGGTLCSVQQPWAILLLDPEERGSVPATSTHWYVSTQYIYDCIEKNKQLNFEDYKINPEVVHRRSTRLNSNKEGSFSVTGGRQAYTPEDDAAILSYVSKHKADVGGNRLWLDMERQKVTAHSWQSMKYRYRARLAKRQSEVQEEATTEEDAQTEEGKLKAEEDQEMDTEKPSTAEDAAAPQTHSAESDLTQIDAGSTPAENTEPETAEAQTSTSPQIKEQQTVEEEPCESTQTETVVPETPDVLQPEGPRLDPQADAPSVPAESAEPEPEPEISPQKDGVPEDSPPAPPKSTPTTPAEKKARGKEKASPRAEQPQRRSARRQLQPEESPAPEPHGKNLRSSSASAERPASSPQPPKKTKSAVKSPQRDTSVDQPPSKKARGTSATAVESERAADSETAQADTESNSVPQKEEKRKEKRKLGILELATKEFEDDSESDEIEAPESENPTETATIQPASTEPRPDTAASTQSDPEHGLRLQGDAQEPPAPSNNLQAEEGRREPADSEGVRETCPAHMFIFSSESQEDDSQSLISNAAADPQSTVDKDAAFSLSQVQLEEDKQRITELMEQTNQDLLSVTRALLKTSGFVSAAHDLLLNPLSFSGPFWSHHDDDLLLSADPVVRQQLLEKYGEEEVAKRVVFLEVEG